jgi:HK97 family phage major capsid protein
LYADDVDVQAVGTDGGAPTRALLLAMEAAVGAANGDAGADARIGWATSPAGRKKLRSVDGSPGTAGAWLWSDANTVLGSPAVASSNVPANLVKGSGTGLSALVHGDWGQLFINMFSGADILVDPYKQNTDGYVYINVYVDVDVAVLNPAAFSIAKDMLTS